MKYFSGRFKGLLLSVILLCVFIFLFSLLVPTRISTNKLVTSNYDSVIGALADVSTYKHWYAPLAQDTNITPMYSANTKGVGAYVLYGDNKLTITKVLKNEVLFEVENKTGSKIKSGFEIVNTTSADTNFLQWYFVTGNNYIPWQRFRSIALEKIMKPEMRKSLDDFGHYLNNGAPEDGIAINDDFCDDSLLLIKNVPVDTSNKGLYLFKAAADFKAGLLANGYTENEVSKGFYTGQNNGGSFIAFGVKNNKGKNTLALPKSVKQLDVLISPKNNNTAIAFKALENYAAKKNYTLWQNFKLTKYINWQFASATQKPNIKLLFLYQ